jgi:hypothetical protein
MEKPRSRDTQPGLLERELLRLAISAAEPPTAVAPLPVGGESSPRRQPQLHPCHEPTERWEASGVLVKNGHYFVVFDDRGEIARIADDLQADDANGLFGTGHADPGCEGITYNAAKQRFYLLVEARKHSSGCYKASIIEYDNDFRYLKDWPVDFTFEHSNKGFEAVVHLRRDSKDYLLALCERNKCKGGDKGRKPGGGRVLLFEKKKKCWLHSRTVTLPRSLPLWLVC